MNWLPALIGTVGACLIVAAFLQTLHLIFALALMSKPFEEDNPHSSQALEGENRRLTQEKNKEEKKPRLLPEDKEERKKELKKIFIYSELVKPKFDEGLEQNI